MNQTRDRSTKTLLIDNYDSYTFNLYQLISKVNHVEPFVIHNDSLSWEELEKFIHQFDNIVISPGPGLPQNIKDFGICEKVLKLNIPVLGVCLGHQGIAVNSGGLLILSSKVAHGVVSEVYHNSEGIFLGIPSPIKVVRYHSWIVAQDSLPPSIKVSAKTADGIIMALEDTQNPYWGVQFHPESICTEYGEHMMRNFMDFSLQYSCQKVGDIPPISVIPIPRNVAMQSNFSLQWRKLDKLWIDSEEIFYLFLAGKETYYWLDSSRVNSNVSRFSFMGLSRETFTYDLSTRQVERNFKERFQLEEGKTFFDFMEEKNRHIQVFNDEKDLPFEFWGGYVGYFGYEMRFEAGCKKENAREKSRNPDSAFMFADRLIAIDHVEKSIYLVGLVEGDPICKSRFDDWMDTTEQSLHRINEKEEKHKMETKFIIEFSLEQSWENYIKNIERCKEELMNGESYEICLTNKVLTSVRPPSEDLYLTLRKKNPAPFAALIKFPHFDVVCSSPERFMKISRSGEIECMPIKGTCSRGKNEIEDEALKDQLRKSSKNFSENLMIVDLIRNDIGKVSKIGSVHVPSLMDIKSYATVHQMVSTIKGQLRDGINSIQCLQGSFPPGSMTGAPKLRSMEILDSMECSNRGVYSGILGYLSSNGAIDFNVIIRTAVIDQQGTYIGCGGAIVIDSDKEEEFDEMLLKANVLVRSIQGTVGQDPEIAPLRVHGSPYSLYNPVPVVPTNFSGENFLGSLATKAIDLSLDRIKTLLSFLNNPQDSYAVIHVTGTNGKGSVCAYLSSILSHAHYKVGRFISPHLIQWTESIQINDEDISTKDFNEICYLVFCSMKFYNVSLTQFEALTAAALIYFFQKKVDIAVIEVGMGGLLDATNVFTHPLVACISSIGLDHVEFLGNTLEEIAANKAGIIKKDCTVVISNLICPEAQEVIKRKAEELNCNFNSVKPATMLSENDNLILCQDMKLHLPLNGVAQLSNISVVIKALQSLKGWNINQENIIEGLKNVKWPARLQWISWRGRKILIDGSHNIEAGKMLKEYVDTFARDTEVQWIIGMLSRKNHAGYFSQILRKGDSVCFVTVKPNVTWLYSADPNHLLKTAQEVQPGLRFSSVIESVDVALDSLLLCNKPIVLCGSFHLCGEVLALFSKCQSLTYADFTLRFKRSEFDLLETIKWTSPEGFFLLDKHLQRLELSAKSIGYELDVNTIRKKLDEKVTEWKDTMRIRLLIGFNKLQIESHPMIEYEAGKVIRLRICKYPFDSQNLFLMFKTTAREVYDREKRNNQDVDDVVFYNEKGEVTETSIFNIAIKLGEDWITPPIESGLLAGTMRQSLLERGVIKEHKITIKELKEAQDIEVFNSVRGKLKAVLEKQ